MAIKADLIQDLQFEIKRFSDILDSNNTALLEIAQLQQSLQSKESIPIPFIVKKITNILVETYKMVRNLNELSDGRYSNLFRVYERVASNIRSKIGENTYYKDKRIIDKFVIPFSNIDRSHIDIVGEKIAFLCDIKNKTSIPVPDGFAITENAYRLIIEKNNLSDEINSLLRNTDITDMEALYKTSAKIQQKIINTKIPDEFNNAIHEAFSILKEKSLSDAIRVSVRSSALFESNQYTSFAGQYRSILNVSEEELNDAYLRVVASKFEPEAIIYARIHGYEINDLSMCVGVQQMIKAKNSGIMYTQWQQQSQIMIQAIYGLGLYIVNGSLIPDTYIYDLELNRVIQHKLGEKPIMLTCDLYGTREEKVNKDDINKPVLTEEQVVKLSKIGKTLTDIYKMPLDIEWATDENDHIFLLQCRPLLVIPEYVTKREEQSDIDIEWTLDENGMPYMLGYVELGKKALKPKHITVNAITNKVIFDGGIIASPGIAIGKAFNVNTDLDILRFPSGSIAITKTANPRLAVLLTKVKGIVSEKGDMTGHLATVAREMRIPALFGTGNIIIPDETQITLDATNRKIYEGIVEEFKDINNQAKMTSSSTLLLESLLKDIAVLNIPNPKNSNIQALRCKTVHDIIRFVHQIAIEEMFRLCDNKIIKGYKIRRIISPIPIELIAFDLGGGIIDNAPEINVPLEDVVSIPMRALWNGMMYKGIKWSGERNINISGLVSAMASYMVDKSTSIRELGAPSYVFITKYYMNFNSRVGYHFTTIDAYSGEQRESNYINFRFSGGANALDRRSRRASLIERILSDVGFVCVRTMDVINARITNLDIVEMQAKLEYVGRLLGFVNRLDIAMVADNDIEKYYNAFKEQRYNVL